MCDETRKAQKLALWRELNGSTGQQWTEAAFQQTDERLVAFCQAHAVAAYRAQDEGV